MCTFRRFIIHGAKTSSSVLRDFYVLPAKMRWIHIAEFSRMIYTNVPLFFLLHSIYIYVVADSVQEKVRRLIEEHHEQINQVNDKYLPISCSKSSVIQPLITFEINDCKTNFYNFRLSMRLKMYSQFLALFLFSSLNDNKCEFDRRICVGEYILNSPTNTDKRSETSKTLK